MAASQDARTKLERSVRSRLLEVPDVHEGEAVFGDPSRKSAFFVDAKQMANFVGENSLAIRLSRKEISGRRTELKADERVDLLRAGGDWIGVRFNNASDVAYAVELAAVAAAVYRPRDRPARLPPSGADLARRQRFH